jgi:CheY-like chemotaxis protein
VATRIVHFGLDHMGVLDTLMQEGFDVDEAGTSIEKLNLRILDRPPDALAVSEDVDAVPVAAISSVLSANPSLGRILFQDASKRLDSALFDLVIPFSSPTVDWLAKLNNLLAKSSELRSQAAELLARSSSLSNELMGTTAQVEAEIQRSRHLRLNFQKSREGRLRSTTQLLGPLRTLIVDDNSVFRRKFLTLLRDAPTLIVGEAEDGLEAVRKAIELQPDVILLDIGLPSLSGIEVARRIRRTVPHAKILFVTATSDPEFISAAFDLGAQGFLSKANVARHLIRAIETILRGGRYLGNLK